MICFFYDAKIGDIRFLKGYRYVIVRLMMSVGQRAAGVEVQDLLFQEIGIFCLRLFGECIGQLHLDFVVFKY